MNRTGYSQAELQKLISALARQHADQPASPERFWIPLTALYSGMRLNEICQLYCDDVKRVDGVWCFDVNQNTPDKKLKSAAGGTHLPSVPFGE